MELTVFPFPAANTSMTISRNQRLVLRVEGRMVGPVPTARRPARAQVYICDQVFLADFDPVECVEFATTCQLNVLAAPQWHEIKIAVKVEDENGVVWELPLSINATHLALRLKVE